MDTAPPGPNIPLLAGTVLLVLLVVVFLFWLQSVRWLVQADAEGLVSRRPTAQRIASGVLAALCAWGASRFVSFLTAADTPARDEWPAAPYFMLLLSFCALVFLFRAGPRRLLIDLPRGRYSFTRGFPLLAWTRRGPLEGSEFSLGKAGSGFYQVRFRASGWRSGLPLELYMTKEDAHALARRLETELGLSVRRG